MKIELTRGDTLKLTFTRKDSDGETITRIPDAIFFTVKYGTNTSDYVLQKTIDDMAMNLETGQWTFYIEPQDTNELNYGKYKYDIEVKDTLDQQPYTKTIAIGDFEIKEEVTFISNEV